MINLGFDLSFNGFQYGNIEAGIFRVSDELFKRLLEHQDMKLYYTVFGYENYPMVNDDVENYLVGKKYPLIPKINNRKRRKFLPFRKEKLFRFFYKKWGINNYYQEIIPENLEQIDIYYSVFYPIPEIIQRERRIKKVITVHDTIPLFFPEIENDVIDNIIKSIDSQTTVIVVSENTKKDLLEYATHINPNNVFVCPLAASPEIFYPCNDAIKFEEVRLKYKLPQKYILGLSTIEPRKNIPHLIRCFVKTIVDNKIEDLSLVLVGKKGWLFDEIFQEYENAKELKDRIIFTGFVPDQDLASIYSHAQSFYYMSFYEGFGLPPLEAMQCGTPVVVSNNSSLPEVVGDSGILLDAKDEKGLSQTIKKLYENKPLRALYSKKSIEQAQKFSWEKMVDTYVEIFKKVTDK